MEPMPEFGVWGDLVEIGLGDAYIGEGWMRKVSEYEAHAAECRKMAAQMKNPVQKAQLEEMADAWDMMAGARKKQLKKQLA